MSVRRDVRGQGLARRTLTALEDEARTQGRSALVLTTLSDWTDACRLYETHGFTLTHQAREAFDDGVTHTLSHYRKDLP